MEKLIIDNLDNEYLDRTKKMIDILKHIKSKTIKVIDKVENKILIFSLNDNEELEIFIEDNK